MKIRRKTIKGFSKKVLLGCLSASMVLTGISFSPASVQAAGNYNYGDALSKSLLFYQLQESGKLSAETKSRTNWRDDSGLNDGKDANLDLTGGWYDAGDNVKFNLPMAYSAMILGWSYLNDTDAYTKSNQEKWMLHNIQWANDYLVKCNPDAHTYYYQVGDGNKDHSFWGAPEIVEEKMTRPSFKVDDTSANGGSAVTGEAAASLAVASLAVKSVNPSKSATYLAHAKTLFNMAEKAQSDEGYTAASGFYNSWSGFNDELALSAAWLYKATGDKTYLTKAETYAAKFGAEMQGGTDVAYSWPICWDDVHLAADLALADITGDKKYYKILENSIDCWSGELEGSNSIKFTQAGLGVVSQWGSIRYACNEAFLCTIYAGLAKADSQHISKGDKFIEKTVNYVLGSSGRSFMVGYDSTSPKNPHHRAAHGCWNNSLTAEPAVSRHSLVGAVVGGPASASDSDYEDDRGNYQTNEVATDYNAGFTGACAYMYKKAGFGAVTDASAVEKADGKEYVIQAGINCQDANNAVNFVELKIVVQNRTAWPARVSKDLKLRAYFDLSDVADPSQMKLSTTYMQYPITFSAMKPTDKAGIYYTEIDLSNARIYPGGQSECKCEIQLRISAPGKWNYKNSPCVKGIGGTSNSEMSAPAGMDLYENGVLVYGEGSSAAPDPQEPETQEPETETQTQEPETQEPETETQTQQPETETQTQQPETQEPETETQTQQPETQEPETQEPETQQPEASGVKTSYTINNWGSGYQVLIKVANTGKTRVENWTVKVNKNDIKIDSSWNVNIKESGNYYVITPMEWNKIIEPGNAVEFGIQGAGHIGNTVEIFAEGESREPETQEPETETQTQQPETQEPETETQTQQPETQEPETETQTQQPETQEPETQQPETPHVVIPGDDWLHTDGAKILDKNGKEVYLTGANWFGFNCSEKVFHGLWSANMKSVVEGMANHGINIVRVPISTELLLDWKAGKKVRVNINSHANPELKRADGSDMDSREIFDTFVKLCKENGIKIMMDLHSLDANNSGHNYPTWYGVNGLGTQDWINGWVWFANEYKNDDTIIACDLKNEPHGKYSQSEKTAAKWDDSTDEANWQYAASCCGKAILDVNPNLLIMVEGIEETPRAGYDYNSGAQDPNATEDQKKYYGGWWGGNLRNAEKYPVDLGRYQSQLVYSPHDYGPLVYKQAWFDKDFTEQTLLDDVWYDSWFYIQDKNIAPLLIGEWGGFMDGGDNEKYLNLMSSFIAKNKINHTFWCINPNSGDTGGLLEGDWATWDAKKYNMMKKTLWTDAKTGKFVGLDHEIKLGSNGENVTEYYK